MNIWRDNYCLENDYDSKTKQSIIFSTLQNWEDFGRGGTCIESAPLNPPLAIRPVAIILHRFAYITAMRLSEIPVEDLRRQILHAPQPNFLHFHAVFRKKFGRIIGWHPVPLEVDAPSRKILGRSNFSYITFISWWQDFRNQDIHLLLKHWFWTNRIIFSDLLSWMINDNYTKWFRWNVSPK